ncbi:MAG TPA: WG repeat-containing protein [Bacillota bacterium]|nr:WG repeat-containing protein [Bacillota bacterium]
MKNRINLLLMASILCVGSVLCIPQTAYGADYTPGQSLVAEDQVKASRGLNFPGLDITWLDLGDNHLISYSSMPDQFSEGIFTMDLGDANGRKSVAFDASGKIISTGNYDEVHLFSDGMALVRKYLPRETEVQPGQLSAPPGYQTGYIDKEGREVIPLGKLDGLEHEFYEGFAVIGGYDQKKGFIDKTGEIAIPQIYLNAGDFSEGLAPVQSAETKLWGYIDNAGSLVIPMEFETAEPFHEGLAYVCKGGLAGYIDKSGKTAIDFQLKPEENPGAVDRNFHDGLAAAPDASGKYGYIDKSGAFAIPAKYRSVEPFTGGLAFVTSENPAYTGGYGSGFLIDRQGERITPLWYYSHYVGETAEEGLIRVIYPYGPSSNESIAVLNQYGAEVIPASLNIENISPFNGGAALLIGSGKDGEMTAGLVKKPENIDEKKSGSLIKVLIDGKRLDFTDTDPVIENSRTLVPMRAIFESLGAQVSWDAESLTATGTKDSIAVSLKIGDKKGYINGKAVDLDVPARIQNARTMVPIRFIAESFQADVSWSDENRTISIETK